MVSRVAASLARSRRCRRRLLEPQAMTAASTGPFFVKQSCCPPVSRKVCIDLSLRFRAPRRVNWHPPDLNCQLHQRACWCKGSTSPRLANGWTEEPFRASGGWARRKAVVTAAARRPIHALPRWDGCVMAASAAFSPGPAGGITSEWKIHHRRRCYPDQRDPLLKSRRDLSRAGP